MSKIKQLLLVVNPVSGKAKAQKLLLKLTREFNTAGYLPSVYITKDKYSTIGFLKRAAKDFGYIVACGGDGTLSEVVNGVMESGVNTSIGYLPLGSTNDFAKSLGLPSDSVDAIKSIASHSCENIKYHDVGRFGQKYFAYIACTGAFSDTSFSTSQNAKNVLGHTAYVLNGAKALSSIKSVATHIEADGEVYEGNYLFCSVSNTKSVAGIIKIEDDSVLYDDGLFELTIIQKPTNMISLSNLVLCLLSSSMKNENIITRKVSSCIIQTETPSRWSLDGEDGGLCSKADIRVVEKGVKIVR